MNEITTKILKFTNINFGELRTTGNIDDPYFCLADICKILELRVDKVVERLSKDPLSKGVLCKHPVQTTGGIQQMYFVNEDGLYDTIIDSRKPNAKKFRKWITKDVLPSIRKYGAYINLDHEDVRKMTFAVRNTCTAAIDLLNLMFDISKHDSRRAFAFLSAKANFLAEIANGERDVSPVENLVRLVIIESSFVNTIVKGIKNLRNSKIFPLSEYLKILNACEGEAIKELTKRAFKIEINKAA